MLIHVNVDEDVYKYLSKRAEELERSVGQYCSELLTIWSRNEQEPVAKNPFEPDTKEKELELEDIENDLKPEVVEAIKENIEKEPEPEEVELE